MNKQIDPITIDLLGQTGAMKIAYQLLFWELRERDCSAAERLLGRLRKFSVAPLPPGVAAELEALMASLLAQDALDNGSPE